MEKINPHFWWRIILQVNSSVNVIDPLLYVKFPILRSSTMVVTNNSDTKFGIDLYIGPVITFGELVNFLMFFLSQKNLLSNFFQVFLECGESHPWIFTKNFEEVRNTVDPTNDVITRKMTTW